MLNLLEFKTYFFLFQELNPNLEAPTTKVLNHIKTNLVKNSSENLSISKDESKARLHLWINSDLAGFPFCWQMIGEPAHEEMVSCFQRLLG